MNHANREQLIAFEHRIKALWEEGELRYLLHLCGGNEDQLIEIFSRMKEGDWIFSTHRSHYHALHALALFAFGIWRERTPGSNLAGFAFLACIVLFSGSLYGLALGGPSWLGPVTPLGGVAFLGGWLALGIQSLRE